MASRFPFQSASIFIAAALLISGCSLPYIPYINPEPTPTAQSCSIPDPFSCNDFALNVDGRVGIFLGQTSAEAVTITAMRCTQEDNATIGPADHLAAPVTLSGADSKLISGEEVYCYSTQGGSPARVSGAEGEHYSGLLYLQYTGSDNSSRVAVGNLTMQFGMAPVPTPSETPAVTPTPGTPEPTPTPEPTQIVLCPSSCLYGCEPATQTCRNPICPVTCLNGCKAGTDKCIEVFLNYAMNNTDFETGNYSGWKPYSNGFTLFIGQEFNLGGPKNVVLSNQKSSYYEQPYSGYQGSYIASSFPDRRATGGLVSNVFTLTGDYLEFLVVAQEDRDLCIGLKLADSTPDVDCVSLQRNPSTVRYFTPKGIVRPFSVFTKVAWNISDLKDQQGVIEIIDSSTTSYIEVDDFRQSSALEGTLVENLVPSYYTCNHNTICETGIGEYYLWCPDDCPYPSSCRSTAEESGIVDYTLYCHAFKLTSDGLLLGIRNTGAGRGHAVWLTNVKCSQEQYPDHDTYLPVNIPLEVNQAMQVSDGTMPCFDQKGVKLKLVEGETFSGKIFYRYHDNSTNFTWFGHLNFDTVVKNETG